GHRMAGQIRSVNIPKFKDFIKEGEVYAIRNYQVDSNIGLYRSTMHKFKMVIHGMTEILKFKGDFPYFRFDFRNFVTLQDPNNVDESTLFDIIGVVVEIGSVAIKEFNGVPTKMIVFHLIDLEENKLSCTLWNEYVDIFLQHEQQHAVVEGRQWIMIINLCRAKPFD
ncbi:Unknown protein, partial [Striga hermonthica]